MNKHFTQEQIKKRQQEDLPVEKRYRRAKLWRVHLLSMTTSRSYETAVSYADLQAYFEAKFYFRARNQDQLQRPDLLLLLQDYLRTLYVYRSRVGPLLYWRLPMFRRPVDPETGLSVEVPPDQMYKLKMLDLYRMLQMKIDGLSRFDEMSGAIPNSIE